MPVSCSDIQAITQANVPNTGAVTLYALTTTAASGDEYDSGTEYSHCFEHQLSERDQIFAMAHVGAETRVFTLMNKGESVQPVYGYKIVKSDATAWRIGELATKALGAYFRCLCTKMPATNNQ